MAIQVKPRQSAGTQFKGSGGGSYPAISSAARVGDGMVSLGKTISGLANDAQKIFDNEVSAAEKDLQVKEMQANLLRSKRRWKNDLLNGGTDLDSRGVPQKPFDPNKYGELSDQWFSKWYDDNVKDKGYDPDAVTAFNLIFESTQGEFYGSATKLSRDHRVAHLVSTDMTIANQYKTVITDPTSSIEDKRDALDEIMVMAETNSPQRMANSKWWDKFLPEVQDIYQRELIQRNAVGGKIKNWDHQDLGGGYSTEDMDNALKYINEASMKEEDRKTLIQKFQGYRQLREKAEKDAQAEGENNLNNQLSKLYDQGKLNYEIVKDLPNEQMKEYWRNQLKGANNNKFWEADYNQILSELYDGTYAEESDIATNTEGVVQKVWQDAERKGIPAEEIVKLEKRVREVAKNDPITVGKKDARIRAKQAFNLEMPNFIITSTGMNFLDDPRNGFGKKKALQKAMDQKLYKFDVRLENAIQDAINNKIPVKSILDIRSPDYVVNDIIDTINQEGLPPPREEKPVEDEDGVMDFIIDFFTTKDGEETTYMEVYGKPMTVKKGTTQAQAEAQYDTQIAIEASGDGKKRVAYPEGHPKYGKTPDNLETIEDYLLRMNLMGFE